MRGQSTTRQKIILIPDKGRSTIMVPERNIQQTDIIRHKRHFYRFSKEAGGEWFFTQIYVVDL